MTSKSLAKQAFLFNKPTKYIYKKFKIINYNFEVINLVIDLIEYHNIIV